MTFFATVRAFVRLGRPQFLAGGFILYGLGAAIAVAGGADLEPSAYWLGQAGITAVQLMTHYANDYFDFAADRANQTPTRWSGGSRVLPSGVLSPVVALGAALGLGAAGIVLVVALALFGGPGGPAAAVALGVAELLAWSYSAPPATLHSRGLGEITTAVVVTFLTPLTGFLLQAGGLAAGLPLLPAFVCAVLPLVGLQIAMLLAIELPDAVGDAVGGKRTLVVRLGPRRAAALLRAVLVAVYGSLPIMALGPLPPLVAGGAALAFPVALWQFSRLGAGAWEDPSAWEGIAFRGVALVAITGAGELTAFAWMALQR